MSIYDAIDRACGVPPEQRAKWEAEKRRLERDGVLLYCACGAKKWDERIPEYEGFDAIEVQCPRCRPATDT